MRDEGIPGPRVFSKIKFILTTYTLALLTLPRHSACMMLPRLYFYRILWVTDSVNNIYLYRNNNIH